MPPKIVDRATKTGKILQVKATLMHLSDLTAAENPVFSVICLSLTFDYSENSTIMLYIGIVEYVKICMFGHLQKGGNNLTIKPILFHLTFLYLVSRHNRTEVSPCI